MRKSFYILFLICIIAFSVSANFKVVDSQSEYSRKDYILIELTPFDAAKDCMVFINDGNPIPYKTQQQLFPYYYNPDNSDIKIEVLIAANKKYKSKIYYVKSQTKKVKLTLSKKLSDETLEVAKLFAQMANSILRYSESQDMQDFQEATKYFGSLFYLEYFYEDLKSVDDEELSRLIETIKNNLDISNADYDELVNSVFNSMDKMYNLYAQIKEYNKKKQDLLKNNLTMSPTEENRFRSKITNKGFEIWWDIYNIIKTTNTIRKQQIQK